MHPKALTWNKKHYPKMGGDTPSSLLPFNRPCDWCGENVEIGYIHKRCFKEESELFFYVFRVK